MSVIMDLIDSIIQIVISLYNIIIDDDMMVISIHNDCDWLLWIDSKSPM